MTRFGIAWPARQTEAGRATGVPPLRPPAHVRDNATRQWGANHLCRSSDGPRQADDNTDALRPRGEKRYVDGLDAVAEAKQAAAAIATEARGSQTVAISKSFETRRGGTRRDCWSRRPDLNRGPVDYEGTATVRRDTDL